MACARLFPFPSLPVAGAPSRACGGGRGGGGVDAKLRVTRSRVVSASFSAGVPSRACGGGGGGGLDTCAPGPRGARKSARPRSTRSRASVTSGAASRSLFLGGALRKSGPSPRARRSTVGSPARAGAPSRLAFASRHRARSTATHAKWRAARPARSARARRIVSDGQFAVCLSQGTASLVVRDWLTGVVEPSIPSLQTAVRTTFGRRRVPALVDCSERSVLSNAGGVSSHTSSRVSAPSRDAVSPRARPRAASSPRPGPLPARPKGRSVRARLRLAEDARARSRRVRVRGAVAVFTRARPRPRRRRGPTAWSRARGRRRRERTPPPPVPRSRVVCPSDALRLHIQPGTCETCDDPQASVARFHITRTKIGYFKKTRRPFPSLHRRARRSRTSPSSQRNTASRPNSMPRSPRRDLTKPKHPVPRRGWRNL